MIIVDASVAAKWYLLEPFTGEALALLAEQGGNIRVPEVFITEVMGVLVRRANIDKTLRRDSETSIASFAALFDEQLLRVEPVEPRQMERAAAHALDLGHPLKDCIYLAQAMDLGCELVTCDARFAEKAKRVWNGVRVLGDADPSG